MNDKNLVSIIMPSWNSERFVRESIQSVINQTYENWELIFVDDCSSDSTAEIVKAFENPRIKYYRNDSKQGAAFSRNRAIREAKGKYVAFLDSDDLWSPEKLEKMVDFMMSNGYVFAYHNYEKIDEDSNKLNVCVTGPDKVTKRKMYHYQYPGCLTAMYDAEYMGLLQINDIKKNNDYAMMLKLCKKADCYRLNENLAQYRVCKVSISHDKIIKKIKSHYDLFRKCDERSVLASFWYAAWNMWFGICKKIRYERKY